MTPAEVQRAWSLAAVVRATGITAHTLRAWERRYGFPAPFRLPSGHRRYSADQIERLRLITQAIALGHRAGTVVSMAPDELGQLLSGFPATARLRAEEAAWCRDLIERAADYDREGVVRVLQRTCAEMGISPFLKYRAAPLVAEVGRAWAQGRLDIRHEHFLSEILMDLLRGLRVPLEPACTGAPILLATLPGEMHVIGLQMAALTVVLKGRRVRILGTQSPVEEVAAAAERLQPGAVGISVAGSSALPGTAAQLNSLRDKLPPGAQLWAGGEGASLTRGLSPKILVLRTLDDLERTLEGLPDVGAADRP